MKDLNKMRLGVLREIKTLRQFIDNMERSVKSRNPVAIQRCYMFLVHLVYEMDSGSLTPMSVALDVELSKAFNQDDENEVSK